MTYTFYDDFNGTTLSPLWVRNYSFGGIENTWSRSQTSVANGVVAITAQRSGTGWVSDLLDTKTTWRQLYGTFEARMKIPKGQGLWPAFWTYYSTTGYVAEIDTMEICSNQVGANGGNDASLLHNTVHWVNGGQVGHGTRTVDLSLDYHVYGVDWRADHIAFLLDGVEVWRYTDASHIPNVSLPLIVNLAVGGTWCGASDATTPDGSQLLVDWVSAKP